MRGGDSAGAVAPCHHLSGNAHREVTCSVGRCVHFFLFYFFPGLWFHADQFTLLPGGSLGRFASQGRTQALGISLFEALFFPGFCFLVTSGFLCLLRTLPSPAHAVSRAEVGAQRADFHPEPAPLLEVPGILRSR